MWSPARGVIRIDGASIDQWDPEKLGPYIGYMPQDVELFSGEFWSGSKAKDLGLIDGIGNAHEVLKAVSYTHLTLPTSREV